MQPRSKSPERPMRLSLTGLMVTLGLTVGVGILPVQAQFSEGKIGAFVEALRQAAPQTGRRHDGLYSDWQVQPQNIPRWSRACIGRELTPAQFAASSATAREIIACVMRDVLQEEYRASGNSEPLAIRRAAAWWMTGNPNRYNSGDTAIYTQRVLSLYQQQNQSASTRSVPLRSQGQAAPAATGQTTTPTTAYDRYMMAGYEATRRREHSTALLYFKRALDERPNDSYASQAIRNVESYMEENRPKTQGKNASQPTAATPITQQQAVDLINQWLEAKSEIFAPPFNQTQLSRFATGELYASLANPNGLLDWLKNNRAYYRYGVQKVDAVERFAADRDRATIELKITEDRTLYQDGAVNPQHTDFSTKPVRYTLERVDGRWKIADYKTTEGLLLERSILNPTSSNPR